MKHENENASATHDMKLTQSPKKQENPYDSAYPGTRPLYVRDAITRRILHETYQKFNNGKCSLLFLIQFFHFGHYRIRKQRLSRLSGLEAFWIIHGKLR